MSITNAQPMAPESKSVPAESVTKGSMTGAREMSAAEVAALRQAEAAERKAVELRQAAEQATERAQRRHEKLAPKGKVVRTWQPSIPIDGVTATEYENGDVMLTLAFAHGGRFSWTVDTFAVTGNMPDGYTPPRRSI